MGQIYSKYRNLYDDNLFLDTKTIDIGQDLLKMGETENLNFTESETCLLRSRFLTCDITGGPTARVLHFSQISEYFILIRFLGRYPNPRRI